MSLAALLCVVLAAPAGAAAPGHPAAKAAPSAVQASTAPAQPTVEDIYGGSAYRDPFAPLAGAGVAAPPPPPPPEFKAEDFSIHALVLKGVLHDRGAPMALLVDQKTRLSFILRGGRLYAPRGKRVPGVRGTVGADGKSVRLLTDENDVQELRLGGEGAAEE